MVTSRLHLLAQKYQQPLATVLHHTPIVEAIAQMSQAQSTCVLVLKKQVLVGIFTQTDLVRAIANQIQFADMTVEELMSQPVITVNESELEDLTTVLQLFQQYQIRHLPVMDSDGRVLGVVTLENVKTAQLEQKIDTLECKQTDSLGHITECKNIEQKAPVLELQKIEAELQERKHFIEQIINHSPQLLYIFDLITGSNVYLNRQSIDILGYTPEEIHQRGAQFFLDVLHPDDLYLFERNLNHWKNGVDGEVLTTEYRMKHQDGSWRWLRSRDLIFTRDENHRPNKILGTTQDITDSKLAELALHERETMLRNIGNNLPNGALYQVIRELDGSDRFSYLSAGIERLQEVRPEDALKDSSLLYRQLIPEDVPGFVQGVDESMDHLSVFDIQVRIRTPSGLLKWLHFRSQPRLLADGRVAWDGLVVDITDMKRTEETLRQSEALLAESQQVARLGNWEYDLATGKISWSKVLFELFERDPALGEPSYEDHLQMYHPEDGPKLHQAVERAISTRESYKLVKRRFNADGSLMYIEGIGRVQFNSQGQIIRIYGTAQDITTRIQADKSEEKLRLTLEFTHIGIWDWNIQTNEVIWNDNGYRLLGLEPETSITNYQTWRNAIHPEDINHAEQSLLNALAQHNDHELEYRVTHPNGSVRWVAARGRGIYDETGKPLRMLGVIIDIDDRKQAEQRLQEKEHFLSSIYEGVGNPIFVVDTVDSDFCFTSINPAHERFFGFPSHQVQGKTPEQLLPPTLAATALQYYQDCVAAGQTITYEEYIYLKNQDTWWITSLTPLRDEDLHIYRIVGSSINITEQKRAQKMLELQAVITRNMAEGLCLVRENDGVIVYANPKFEQMFGYEAGELIGCHISMMNYEDEHRTAQEVHEAIAAAVMQYGEATYEVHNVKKDGTPFWCQATTSMFEHPEYGKVLVAVQQNITEKKQAEEKIKSSLKEKEVLLQEIHHRVKNNLGIVSSLLQMQCRRTQDPQATAILRDSTNRIASIALVHEKLYRSDDLANIDFTQYIPDLTTHLFDSYKVSSNHIQLNIEVDDVNLDIETAIPCGLIINELVSNALKYGFPDHRTGVIHVGLYQQNQNCLTLIIRDNGVGIPENFDTKKAKTLGITLVSGLVKQLKGTLEIKTHQGTEFKIDFQKNKL